MSQPHTTTQLTLPLDIHSLIYKYKSIDGLSADSQKSYLITNYLITKLSYLITNNNYITEKLLDDPRL